MASKEKAAPAEGSEDAATARAKRLEEVQAQINELVKEREALMSGVDAE